MARYDYNLIVIGAGAAGLVSSYIASATKAKVALIERDKMGGDCLNTGCVPSKALIKAAKVAHDASHSQHLGISSQVSVDFQKAMDHVQQAIKTIEPHDSMQRYTELGVDCIQGEATITGPHTVSVNDQTLTARSIIIATGAEPFMPKVAGLDKVVAFNSDTIWNLTQLPKRLLVVGGGPIGLELGQCFSRLGSKVTIVQRPSRLMRKEDEEVSNLVKSKLEEEGITVLTGHTLERFTCDEGWQVAHLSQSGEDIFVDFDVVLFALGRKARLDSFGFESLKIKARDNGTLDANDFLQTNIPSIYVCGDITGPYQFTHVAAHQAWYASVNGLLSPFMKFKVDYSVIPWVTFTDPEVARVGLSEAEACEQGIAFEVTRYELEELDRAITDGNTTGFVKVLTAPGKDKILGVTIVSEHAGDMIGEFIVAMKHGLGLNKILGTIHPYPTYNEANKFVAGNWRKKHVPALGLTLAALFHKLRLFSLRTRNKSSGNPE